MSKRVKSPLSVYVLWHPDNPLGKVLARHIAQWLGRDSIESRMAGLGIPVHFRSEVFDTTGLEEWDALGDDLHAAGGLEQAADKIRRREIDFEDAKKNVVVALVDDAMLADRTWRRDLDALAELTQPSKGKPGVFLVPIDLGASASLPEKGAALQSVRADTTQRVGEVGQRVVETLAHALSGLFEDTGASLIPREVFLSHAKRDGEDGPVVAAQIRDAAPGFGNLRAFFDESTLAVGQPWKKRLLDSAKGGAGFIAIWGDHYASRPWCQEELELARAPSSLIELLIQRDPTAELNDENKILRYIWVVRPMVVVCTLREVWTRALPDFGAAPVIRWDAEGGPRGAREVLLQLTREAIQNEIQAEYALQLIEQIKKVTDIDSGAADFLTWTPDPSSLLRLRIKLRERDDERKKQKKKVRLKPSLVAYPGFGLNTRDEALLRTGLGDRDTVLISFERLLAAVLSIQERRRRRVRKLEWKSFIAELKPPTTRSNGPGRGVVLSFGSSSDLGRLGYDQLAPFEEGYPVSAHLDQVILQLVRGFVERNCTLYYGGDLFTASGLAEVLRELKMRREINGEAAAKKGIVRVVAWPANERLSSSERVSWSDYAEVKEVFPPRVARREASVLSSKSTEVQRRYLASTALSRARAWMARETSITLAAAGRTEGYVGRMPGIWEEVLLATEQAMDELPGDEDWPVDPELNQPTADDVRVILIGGYGGAARVLTELILDEDEVDIEGILGVEAQLGNPRNARLEAMCRRTEGLHREMTRRYRRLATVISGFRNIARQKPSTQLTRLGITVGQWKDLMETESPSVIRRRVIQVVDHISKGKEKV